MLPSEPSTRQNWSVTMLRKCVWLPSGSRSCSCLTSGCMATPVAQTQAPKGISVVSFFCVFTTITRPLSTEATRLFSTRSMPSLRSAPGTSLMLAPDHSGHLRPS